MTLTEIQHFISQDAFATKLCGIQIISISEFEAIASMPITPQHLNANGVVQGGAIYTLCDTVFAALANANGGMMVNRSAEITYLKPGKGTSLTACVKQKARGKMMGLYTVEVYNDHQECIAYMTVNGFGARD